VTDYALYLESGPRMKTTMVHVLDLLGCLANGATTEAALEATPGEIREFLRFLQRHGDKADPDAPFTTRMAAHVMEGPWIGYGDPAPGFAPDFEPLRREDLAVHLRRLRWLGDELAQIADELPPKTLMEEPAKGRQIREIIRHVAAAEPEYVRTAGLGKPESVKEIVRAIEQSPEGLSEKLSRLWEVLVTRFEAITDEELNKVTQRGQSPYTARRGLRRALEHSWEHLREIQRRLEESPHAATDTKRAKRP
jgi:predicted RNase H-like HicB family nuclease